MMTQSATVRLAGLGLVRSAASRPRRVPAVAEALGSAAWNRLSPAIRARFDERTLARGAVHHRGVMAEVRCSGIGWFFAQACRFFGTPLAPGTGRDVPVGVRVYTDRRRHGVTWERTYHFPGRRPVTVASTKCHEPGDGFLEVAAGGLGMWLDLAEADGRLCFRSRRYFIEFLSRRWALPPWLTPGECLVVHGDEPGRRFRFTLSIRHPLFGETFFQDGVFETFGEGKDGDRDAWQGEQTAAAGAKEAIR